MRFEDRWHFETRQELRWFTELVPSNQIIHVTPQGQPLFAPAIPHQYQEWTPVEHRVEDPPVLVGTCRWCSEQRAHEKAAAVAARAEEERRRQAEAARKQAEADRAHAELLVRRREQYGSEDSIRARIAALRLTERMRPQPSYAASGFDRFFDKVPFLLLLVLLISPFIGGWLFGSTLVENPKDGGVLLFTPLPFGLGLAAMAIAYGVPLGIRAVHDRRRQRLTKLADDAAAEIATLTGQLGCGFRDCERCDRSDRTE